MPDWFIRLYNLARGSAIMSAATEKSNIGRPSGPAAADLFAFLICVLTASAVIKICCKGTLGA